jgi:hypothetical protein
LINDRKEEDMIIAQRKKTNTEIESLDRILHLLNYNKETLLSESPESSFNNASDYVKSIVAKLDVEEFQKNLRAA